MFSNTTNLTNLVMGDSFVTSNVTNLRDMFNDSAVRSLDLSTWDTSSVTDMSGMFQETDTLKNIVLGGVFNSSNVEDFSNFLDGSGVSDFDFSDIETGSATNMNSMLSNMANQEVYDLTFDTSNVTTMEGMLENLNNVISLDISSFDTTNVVNFTDILGTATLDTATSINMGSQSNDDIVPAGYNLSSLTVERTCVATLALKNNDTDSLPSASYFSGNDISLPSSEGSIMIMCGSNAKPGKSVDIICNASLGEIVDVNPAGANLYEDTCF